MPRKPPFPERETLRDVLARLKVKIKNSENAYRQTVAAAMQSSQEIVKIAEDYEAKQQSQSTLVSTMVKSGQNPFFEVIKHSFGLVDDLYLYISTLEKYCAELDRTRWKGIMEATQKMTENPHKQRQEQSKKETGYIR